MVTKSLSKSNYLSALEPYNKFSALLAKKICYLRLLSSAAGLVP
jgi:hypothetical protein